MRCYTSDKICIARLSLPSTLATLFSHRWPRFCGGDIYSRRKSLFSSFGEHTADCGSSVRQAVAPPRHRQSVFVAACHFLIIIYYVAATCLPSVLGSATKMQPPVAKQSGKCARALIMSHIISSTSNSLLATVWEIFVGASVRHRCIQGIILPIKEKIYIFNLCKYKGCRRILMRDNKVRRKNSTKS